MAAHHFLRGLLPPRRVRWAVALGALALTSPALGETSGDNATHDPSRIVESDGRFYFCSTGGHCASSSDGLAWKTTGLRIPVPSWVGDYLTGGNQGIWAPDIIPFEGKYYIYYSACGLPAADAPCLTGLYSTPTLDSASPNFRLTDVGKVLDNPHNDATYQFSTIDPGPLVDADGDLWTAWGSGYGKDQSKTQLWVTHLDRTGLPLASDSAYKPPVTLGHALQTGRKEGPYLHQHGDYYYLFYNTGSCCSGTASDYTIWVARSQKVTGPFTGDKTFYASSGNIHGPGHMGIYSACGVERFTYHYYPTATSILGVNELSWNSDGWPVAGSPATTGLVPCGGAGGDGGSEAGGGSGLGGVAGSGAGGASGRGAGGMTASGGRSATSGNGGAGGAAVAGEAGRDTSGSGGSSGGTAPAGPGPGGGTTSAAGTMGSGASGGAPSDVGGRAGTASTGGELSAGGAPWAGGAPSSSPGPSEAPRASNDGCACAVERSTPSNGLAWLTAVGFSMSAWRSRRRRRGSRTPL